MVGSFADQEETIPPTMENLLGKGFDLLEINWSSGAGTSWSVYESFPSCNSSTPSGVPDDTDRTSATISSMPCNNGS